jgi:oligopeptide transport system ATP-binding protein
VIKDVVTPVSTPGSQRLGRPPAEGRVLDVRNLSVEFSAGGATVRAVRGISYTVAAGETIGIVGESGSGKSASALALLRLLPANGRVTGGQALLGSTDLLTLPTAALNDLRGGSVAMVYQDPLSALNPVLTVGRQITEVIERHRDVSHREAERRAVELLDIVGIPGAKRRIREYPHQFSGGMRQRVMIAMAISCDPTLLIADEPTTALDVTVQAQILDLLGELKRELGMALVVITHDLGIVAGITDRVLIMYAGRIVEEGPTDLVLDDPRMPYTLGLLRSVPRLDLPRQVALTPIPGTPPDPTVVSAGCPFRPRCSFRIERCAVEDPPLDRVGPAHRIACWVDVTTGAPRFANVPAR